jgi:hypothetical protein
LHLSTLAVRALRAAAFQLYGQCCAPSWAAANPEDYSHYLMIASAIDDFA